MRQLKKMGPLEGILGMLPGGSKLAAQASQSGGMPTEHDMAHMEAIVLSMTTDERRRPEIVKGQRRRRIAAGSGTQISDVNKLLKGFEQMQSLFKQMGMGGRGSKGMRGKMKMLKQLKNMDPSQLPR
jgi:signal recognition particle subunit SRP54